MTVSGEGSYVLDRASATITFTPATGFAGVGHGVGYRLTGPDGISATATYRPIATLPHPPIALRLTSNGRAGKAQAMTVHLQVGERVTLLKIGGQPANTVTFQGQGSYRLSGSNRLIFNPVKGFTGRAKAVRYQVTDVYGQHAAATYTARVLLQRAVR